LKKADAWVTAEIERRLIGLLVPAVFSLTPAPPPFSSMNSDPALSTFASRSLHIIAFVLSASAAERRAPERDARAYDKIKPNPSYGNWEFGSLAIGCKSTFSFV
jgi:hypothetical protein